MYLSFYIFPQLKHNLTQDNKSVNEVMVEGDPPRGEHLLRLRAPDQGSSEDIPAQIHPGKLVTRLYFFKWQL